MRCCVNCCVSTRCGLQQPHPIGEMLFEGPQLIADTQVAPTCCAQAPVTGLNECGMLGATNLAPLTECKIRRWSNSGVCCTLRKRSVLCAWLREAMLHMMFRRASDAQAI